MLTAIPHCTCAYAPAARPSGLYTGAMDERVEAIRAMRRLSEQFIAGELPFEQFHPALKQQFACFDPLEWYTRDLPADLRAEVVFFSDWLGGEFGETSDVIPRAAGWRYGQSTESYGWIDKEQYRRQLEQGLRGLTRGPLTGDRG